jgi:hypothetical protein
MRVDCGLVGLQQNRIPPVDLGLVPAQPQPRTARAQHRPTAMKRDQRILRAQHRPMPGKAKGGIGRRQQIARGIGKRSIQIKDHTAHSAPDTNRKAS